MSLQVELATEASSSTTITSVDSLAFAFGATVATNLEALGGKVLLSFGTGGTVAGLPLTVRRWRFALGLARRRLRAHDSATISVHGLVVQILGGYIAANR
jgi:hypothetical protein